MNNWVGWSLEACNVEMRRQKVKGKRQKKQTITKTSD